MMTTSSSDQLASTRARWRMAGTVLVVAALGWFVLEALAAARFPGYSYIRNYISDLGVPDLGVFQGRAMDSQLSLVANVMFCTQGLLFLLAAGLIVTTAKGGAARWVFLLFAVGYAIGYGLIGAFHGSQQAAADGTFALHVLGGSTAVICGNVAIIIAGLFAHRLGAPAAYRNFSVGISALGIASLAVLVASSGRDPLSLLPSGPFDGILERGGCYALILWELVTGVVLLSAGRPRE